LVELAKWEGTLRGSRRMTAGAKPYTMKVVRTVFNGGHEETYGNATRLVPTQHGYCWRISFKVLAVLFLASVSQAFLPSKQAWCAVKAYCKNVKRPRGIQVPREPLELSMADHFAM